ncbi:MAG: Zn-dependent protease with chaperone function [Lysobacterales bacterium]|jgi:Zn-dependent protease with chaperone function
MNVDKRHSYHQQIRRNNRRLRWALLVYFALAVFAGNVTGKAFLFFADTDEYYAHRYELGLDGTSEPDTSLFSYVNQVTFAVLLLAGVNYRRMRRRGDKIVLSLADARPLKDQQFGNTGQEMAIAAGIPSPTMWIVENPSLNAFACSNVEGQASVVLTRGLLEQLSRDEIQAVVGHEVAHIRNGDAQLITVMLGMGRAFHLVSAFALGPLRAFFDAGNKDAYEQPQGDAPEVDQSQSTSRLEKPATVPGVILAVFATPVAALIMLAVAVVVSLGLLFVFGVLIKLFPWLVAGFAIWEILRDYVPAIDQWIKRRSFTQRTWWGGLLFFVPVGLIIGPAVLVLGILVPSLLLLMRLSVSRNREFQADATAVELTRNPGALRCALEKIQHASATDFESSKIPEALSPLTIVPARRQWVSEIGLNWLNDLISTHPRMEERIYRLSKMETRQNIINSGVTH